MNLAIEIAIMVACSFAGALFALSVYHDSDINK